jgi:hypothetical protein
MFWVGGPSFIVHIIINLSFFARRKVFAVLNLRPAPVYRASLMRPNRGAYFIVVSVFTLIMASSTILTLTIFKNGYYNVNYIESQINGLRQIAAAAPITAAPMIAAPIMPISAATLAMEANQYAAGKTINVLDKKTTVPKNGIYYEKVLPGEGFWQPTFRLVEKTNGGGCQDARGRNASCSKLDHYYDTLTADLLIKNGVINKKYELRIARPGAMLSLDPSNNLFIDGAPTNTSNIK